MTVKEILVQDLGLVLEETGNLMVDKMVLESLAKNGTVSLEEAEFYNTLVRRVITEAAEEFVPDELPAPEPELEMQAMEEPAMEDAEDGETLILTGEDGTVYEFNTATKELIPVDGGEVEAEVEVAPEMEAEGEFPDELAQESTITEATDHAKAADTTDEVGEKVEEPDSAEVKDAGETDENVEVAVVEESSVVELTESQMIVSNLIKSLGA